MEANNQHILYKNSRTLVCKDKSLILLHWKLDFLLVSTPLAQNILHGHLSSTHLLIWNLKALTDSDFFISVGTKSYIFRPNQFQARQNFLFFSKTT